MEARPRKDGKVTYRYHPIGAKPVNLGTDRDEAIRQVLGVAAELNAAGTVRELWNLYRKSTKWADLKPRTQSDYEQYSVNLLDVMGDVASATIRQSRGLMPLCVAIERWHSCPT
jgi:hypothetical protein